MSKDQAIEKEIQAKGLTAARITPEDVEANIVGEHYHHPTGYDWGCGTHVGTSDIDKIKRHTVCILTLRNGFTVVGVNEGPVSAANFDQELGRKLAREKAVDQIWPLMGYELRSRLAAGDKPDHGPTLRAALAKLVGASSKDEIQNLRFGLSVLPASSEDRAAMEDALQALEATAAE